MKKLLSVIMFLLFLCLCSGCDSDTYNEASNLFEDEKYEDAQKLYEKIPNYKDSKDKIQDCKNAIDYENAFEKYNNEEYSQAKLTFEKLGDYKDCKKLISNCEKGITYQLAVEEFNGGSFDEAKKRFSTLSGFKDSDKYLEAIKELKPYIGLWHNLQDDYEYKSDLKGLNSDYKLNGSIMCTIGYPYELEIDSSYEKGWCAKAQVHITANYRYNNGIYNGIKKNNADIKFVGDFLIMKSEVTGKNKMTAICNYDNTEDDTLFIPGYYSSKELYLYFSDDCSTLDILEKYDSFAGTRTTLKKFKR